MKETAATTTQAEALGAVDVPLRNGHVKDLRGFGGGTRVDGDRMAIEGADLVAIDFVAGAAGMDRFFDIGGLDGLADFLVQGPDHLVEVRIAVLVQFEVELVRLVAEHKSQRPRDALDQIGLVHTSQKRAGLERRKDDVSSWVQGRLS